MSDFNDINELITVARQINEGRYDLINVNLDPASELFTIAQYFNDSIKKLKSVSTAVSKTYETLPAFEASLNLVIQSSHQASEEVLSLVDKVNFNIDAIKELLAEVDAAILRADLPRTAGLLDRFKDICTEGSEICYDMIASLEFKEIATQKLAEVLSAIDKFQERLAGLVISLGLKQQVIDSAALDKFKDTKEILKDQTLVNKLLQEFGL
ncbi:MAG: chemotaxis protein [Deferribacteraceae bacterium]|jgi:chemotaxis protein CheZ|nr:chemotaxis protein [Deferribacteraceae bacterium]